MSIKLSRIERLIRDRPEMFDYADIPTARVKIPAQEAAYDAMRPQWAKMLGGESEASPASVYEDDGQLDLPDLSL